MSFTATKATRQGIIPLIFLWGGTGGGKTESALRLARGMAGPTGKVVIGDSENKRGLLPWDRIEGRYEHVDFQPPFSPERYGELLTFLEQNADVGVVDSGSHLWNGPDGILEAHEQVLDKMVGDNWERREAAGWRAWKEPKMRLAVLEARLLRCKIPLIVCFRGEIKSKLVKDDRGKSSIIHTETTIPIFDLKFLFEALVACEVYQNEGGGGLIRFPFPYAKVSHAGLAAALPKADKERLNFSHGQALALWCAAGGASTPQGTAAATLSAAPSQPPAVAPSAPRPKLTEAEKKARWKARCVEAGGGHESYAVEYAVEEGIILDTEGLDDWPVSKHPRTAAEVETILTKIRLKAGLIPTEPDPEPVKETLP